MKATLVNRDGYNVELAIEVSTEEVKKAANETYLKNRKHFRVDGFRPGKAPRHIIEAKYGKNVFYDEAITDLFNEVYPKALEELKLEPVDHPQIDFDDEQVATGNGFTYKVLTIVSPEVALTPDDYKGIKVVVPETDITEEEIEKQIESLRKRNARLIKVDRPAENEDTVVIDYMGFKSDGTQFEGGTATGHKLKLGSNQFIPGFEEQLVSVQTGDEVEVDLTFPMDYQAEELAGEEVTFKVKVHEILEEELPELDDDFAKEVSEFDTLEEMKADAIGRLEKNKKESNSQRAKNHALETIYNKVVVDIPAPMIESEIEEMMKEFDQQLSYQGMDIKSYLKMVETPVEEFREQLRTEAERKVKTRLIVMKIAELEGCEFDQASVETEIARLAMNYGMKVDDMRSAIGNDIHLIEKDVIAKKALEKLFEYCDIEEVPIVAEEAAYKALNEEAEKGEAE